MKLSGKTILITGGNSGIGLATAKLLAKEGAKLILVGRDQKTLAAAANETGAITITLDVSKVGEIEKAFATLGPIDGLFINAGVSHAPELKDMTERDYDSLMNINVKGAFFTLLKALPHLTEKASVVLTSSVSHDRGKPGDPIYSASKAAVRSFARTFAADDSILSKKIRVNCVSPGAILTPLTQQENQPEIDAYIEAIVPMKRWGEADEIAKAVLFLLSDDSSYMTGAEIAVDGGLAQI